MHFRTKAPFGVSVKRFENFGVHPNLDPLQTIKREKRSTAPGCYEPKTFECAYKKTGISPWSRKVITEEFSQNMGFRNKRVLEYRRFMQQQGGPGNYDIEDKKKSPSCFYDVGFGTERRFRPKIKSNNPPVGTYALKKIPKRGTEIPTFEWDGFVDRFKGNVPSWKQPPNRYDPKDEGSIAATLAKVVSKRGPYDCFTGPRDDTTIKNHFAPPAFKGPLNYFTTWPNELEILLTHPRKKLYGRFLHENRFPTKPTQRNMLNDLSLCYRNPNEPGPAHYSVTADSSEVPQNLHPFNSSRKFSRPPLKWVISPGPGRYKIKLPRCTAEKGQSWVFKSKTKREVIKVIEYNSF